MNKISIGFSRPKAWKPFSWAIMKGYGTPYAHVYIKIYSSKYDRQLIYQASHMTVNFMSPSIFMEENIIVDEFDLEIENANYIKMMQFAIDNVGKPYGVKEAFGLAIVRIADLLGKKIKNPFRDGGKTYVCCELGGHIAANYASVGISTDFDDLNPKELYEILRNLKKS